MPLSLIDYHLHTHFSVDGRASPAEMCLAALQAGVQEIGFNEHFDLHWNEPFPNWFRPEPWFVELQNCRDQFAAQGLILRAGIEIGEPHLFSEETHSLLAAYPFDYALGSVHFIGTGESAFDTGYFTKYGPRQGFTLYFEELTRMTAAGGFDILAHFDVAARLYSGPEYTYDPRDYADLIRTALRNCVEHGIVLEINTAGLRKPARVLNPGRQILEWYVELGGTSVTLGSDGHRPHQAGFALEQAYRTAQAAGVRSLAHFEHRQISEQTIL
jgi:histidinol-phosphatase (PHP family)